MVPPSWARRRALRSLAVVGLTLAWPVAAQDFATPSFESPPPAASATLEHAPAAWVGALRQVWQRNPAAQAAEAKRVAANARTDAASRPIYNPELELTAENADVNTRSVGLSQTIDWSGKRQARTIAATADARVVEAERDQIRQRIALQWLGGFASYRVASQQVALGAQRVGLLEQFAALANRRFAAGDIPSLERDLAELALQEARVQQAELLAGQAKARQLFAAVGAGDTDALPDLSDLLPDAARLPLDATVLETLPALRQSEAEVDAAQARVGVAERERRPDPTVGLTGGRVTSGPFEDTVVGIHLRIPLFVRNDYGAEVTASRSAADAAAATLLDQRQRAIAEAEQAGASYNALRDAWQAWQASRAARTSDRAVLLQRLWEAGELSTSDYLVQLKQGIDTELTATGLRARVWQAFADWLAASGGLERWLDIDGATP